MNRLAHRRSGLFLRLSGCCRRDNSAGGDGVELLFQAAQPGFEGGLVQRRGAQAHERELRRGAGAGAVAQLRDALLRGGHAVQELLAQTDVLIDGPFVQALKSYTLTWKGSSNQRVIDIAALHLSD